jgi:tetratricopeptide (TPR) repeat protein
MVRMARLITVSIDCRNEAARQIFEEIFSRRPDYLVTKGQGTGAVDMLLLELDEIRPQQTFGHIRELLSASPDLEVFLTASRTDPQVLLARHPEYEAARHNLGTAYLHKGDLRAAIEKAVVHWPSGKMQELSRPQPNRVHKINPRTTPRSISVTRATPKRPPISRRTIPRIGS